VEGRVVEVQENNNEVAMLMYDGDGNQVKVTRGSGVTSTTVYVGNDGGRADDVPLGDGVTTVYIGNYYEKEGNTTRTYYYHNGQRVAVRENGTLYWLLKDHLGSTAVVVDASGTVTGERRYLAYGDTRAISGTVPTRYGFTGQREESLVGLYFYNARWYDPVLRRLVQADTVVPEALSYPRLLQSRLIRTIRRRGSRLCSQNSGPGSHARQSRRAPGRILG
jgi:RHS repeat-associated protein